MLNKIHLTGFKSFVDESVELKPLTLLIGANATGKSNLLDAILFLAGLVKTDTLHEVFHGGKGDRWPGIRGGAQYASFQRRGEEQGIAHDFTVRSDWTYAGQRLDHRIKCRTRPSVRLLEESLKCDQEPAFETKNCDSGLLIQFSENGGQAQTRPVTDDRTLIWQILGRDKYLATRPGRLFHSGAFNLLDNYHRIQFFDLHSPAMRERSKRSRELNTRGENLSGVLAELIGDPKDPDAVETIKDWLAELCAPELSGIDFISDETREYLGVVEEQEGGRFPFSTISDGTLRFLAILAAVFSARKANILLIEEITAGLHPARSQVLVEFLENAAASRGIQIIATTHSTSFLDWLEPETLEGVLVFGRIPESPGSIVRPLIELPNFRETAKRRGVSDLVATGWLEMAL